MQRWRPGLKLDVLIESAFAPVFANHPAVHETLILQNRKSPESEGWTRVRAIWELARRRYPAVVNLHGGTTSMLFTAASGAGLRIGQESHRGSRLYNARIPAATAVWQRAPLHTVEHQLTLLKWLGLPAEPAGGNLHVAPSAGRRIEERLAHAGISEYLLIQPTATLPTKQWEPRRFAQLGDRLTAEYGLPVVYSAAPHEREILQAVRESARQRHYCWSDLALEDLFALIERCRMFVGCDSGPAHAAAALKKPVVAVWGSSDFNAWHPWKTEYEAVRSDLPCIPCPGYRCDAFDEPRCIRAITVERVLDACRKLMERSSSL